MNNKVNVQRKRSVKQRLFRWIKVLVLLYCIIGIALFYLQQKFLFHPKKLDSNYQFHFAGPFTEVKIPFNETDTVDLVKFFPPDSVRKGVVIYYHGNMENIEHYPFPPDSVRKGVVIYYHGNMENIEHYQSFVPAFTKHGYEVWMEDYPGFGKSTGERTEKKLYAQALEIERMAAARFGKDSIILYGKSLGTGIAAYVASQTDVKRLILETPYSSIPDLFSAYAPIYPTERMSDYKIPTKEYLLEVKYPISIFHGTSDNVVFYSCAQKLKAYLKPTDEFITIEKGNHHNLASFALYNQKLDSLLTH